MCEEVVRVWICEGCREALERLRKAVLSPSHSQREDEHVQDGEGERDRGLCCVVGGGRASEGSRNGFKSGERETESLEREKRA
jgi:hypothetical protein